MYTGYAKLKRGLMVPNFFGKISSTLQQSSLLQGEPGYRMTFSLPVWLCTTKLQARRSFAVTAERVEERGDPRPLLTLNQTHCGLQTNWFYSTGHLTICKIQTHLHCYGGEKNVPDKVSLVLSARQQQTGSAKLLQRSPAKFFVVFWVCFCFLIVSVFRLKKKNNNLTTCQTGHMLVLNQHFLVKFQTEIPLVVPNKK